MGNPSQRNSRRPSSLVFGCAPSHKDFLSRRLGHRRDGRIDKASTGADRTTLSQQGQQTVQALIPYAGPSAVARRYRRRATTNTYRRTGISASAPRAIATRLAATGASISSASLDSDAMMPSSSARCWRCQFGGSS